MECRMGSVNQRPRIPLTIVHSDAQVVVLLESVMTISVFWYQRCFGIRLRESLWTDRKDSERRMKQIYRTYLDIFVWIGTSTFNLYIYLRQAVITL